MTFENNFDSGKNSKENTVPIVVIGAAEGGMESISELLSFLPSRVGLIYIFIFPSQSSGTENPQAILANISAMEVLLVKEGMKAEKDHFYCLNPTQSLSLSKTSLLFEKKLQETEPGTPINDFMTSIANEFNELSIGVLLSGSDADGVLGAKAIKLAGGLTFAQDQTAQFQTLTKRAIAEGSIDKVLSIKELANELSKLGSTENGLQVKINEMKEQLLADNDEGLHGILQLLYRTTVVNFALYKMNTIKRRILRRMMLHKLENSKAYLGFLKNNLTEVNFLYQDLLINVTAFFRDDETSDYLKNNILPKIIQSKNSTNPIRVWIPACSTGQEAYSLAMLIIESLGENPSNIQVQIYATDLSENAINKARLGTYSKDEVAGLSPKRLQRFFNKVDGSYRITKSLRNLCVFSYHNLVKDPPFSRLNIISCCNLLIYLDTILQTKIMSTFHYSLNTNGYLILGKSETVGTPSALFSQVDKKVKIYIKKKENPVKSTVEMNYRAPEPGRLIVSESRIVSKVKTEDMDMEKAVNQLLLEKFTPACVIVNHDLDILQFRGATGIFLEHFSGKASLNLMKMAKPGLGFELKNIVHKAKTTGNRIKKNGLEIIVSSKPQRISIEAMPIKMDGEEDYYLVIFETMDTLEKDIDLGTIKDKRVRQLEEELKTLREDMRSIVEAQEAANEELQSANEEIVSSNEELQSINEELETSKEEIESSNEELITINQELQIRNEQLAEAQEYAQAVFTTIGESLLILDKDLRVKSANRTFYKTFRLLEEETESRHIYDLDNKQWNIASLKELLEEKLMNSSQYYGFEITHYFKEIGEKVLLLNACKMPQKGNADYVILLALEDITEHRQGQKIIAEREAWFRNMADNAPVMIWVTGKNMLCDFLNKSFLDFRGITINEAIGKSWLEEASEADYDRCNKIYTECFIEKKPFEFVYNLKHRDGNYRKILTKAKPNYLSEGSFSGFIGTCVELDEIVKKAVG